MRTLGLFVLAVLIAVTAFAFFFPAQFQRIAPDQWASVAAMVGAALLVGGGVFAMRGAGQGLGAGRALLYIAIWFGLIVLMVMIYRVFGPGVADRAVIGT